MDNPFQAEWAGASEFAEVAEALSVRTDQVMASVTIKGITTCLFTPDPADDPKDSIVWGILLRRDDEGILRTIETSRKQTGTFAEFLEAAGLDD